MKCRKSFLLRAMCSCSNFISFLADTKIVSHNVYRNKTQFGEKTAVMILKCGIQGVQMIPAMKSVPEVPAGLFLKHDHLLLKYTLHSVGN